MNDEATRQRQKRVTLIFEDLGEAEVRSQLLSAASGSLFKGHSDKEPSRDEAEEWLKTRSRNRKIFLLFGAIGTAAAIVAAVFSVLGYFKPT
jgi:hypothetical protein